MRCKFRNNCSFSNSSPVSVLMLGELALLSSLFSALQKHCLFHDSNICCDSSLVSPRHVLMYVCMYGKVIFACSGSNNSHKHSDEALVLSKSIQLLTEGCQCEK